MHLPKKQTNKKPKVREIKHFYDFSNTSATSCNMSFSAASFQRRQMKAQPKSAVLFGLNRQVHTEVIGKQK